MPVAGNRFQCLFKDLFINESWLGSGVSHGGPGVDYMPTDVWVQREGHREVIGSGVSHC